MKNFVLGIVVTVAGLFAPASGACAETNGAVTVHINQNFFAGGKSLSAGTYKVYQGSSETGQWLILRSKETGASVFLLASTHDGIFPGQFEAKLSRAGTVYYLSEVVTDLGIYTFTAPHTPPPTAKKTEHDKVTASGINGTESAPATK